MTVRGAYVELNFGHGEIQPTFWWIARHLGIELDFHMLGVNAGLDPLGTVPGPASVTPIEVDDPHDPLVTPIERHQFADTSHYDFYVLGTPEPADRARAMLALDRPQLHVRHNVDPIADEENPPHVTSAVLAPHVAGIVCDPVVVVEPLYTGDHPKVDDADVDSPVVVTVPGNVDVRRRNYGSLVRSLAQLAGQGVSPDQLRVELVGRAASPPAWNRRGRFDTERVRRALDDHGIAAFVHFTDRELTYPEVHRRVATAPFVASLVDDFYLHTRRYVESKHTASIAIGIGGAAIPILNGAHAEAVGVDIGPRYGRDALTPALRQAIEWPDITGSRETVAALRDDRLRASAEAFGGWLERVT